jgi:hypothetical protein
VKEREGEIIAFEAYKKNNFSIMSHSAFRILANDEPINRNLVIVVNKNGQVSTDTEVLQSLLSKFLLSSREMALN